MFVLCVRHVFLFFLTQEKNRGSAFDVPLDCGAVRSLCHTAGPASGQIFYDAAEDLHWTRDICHQARRLDRGESQNSRWLFLTS